MSRRRAFAQFLYTLAFASAGGWVVAGNLGWTWAAMGCLLSSVGLVVWAYRVRGR